MASSPRVWLPRAVFVAALAATALRPAYSWAAVHEVSIISFAFEPPVLVIEQGDTVRWTVKSGRHSATGDDDIWNSGVMPPGATFERRFDEPGAYTFHCTPHSFMQGRIVVREAPTIDPSLMVWALAILGLAIAAAAAGRLARRKQR